MDNLLNDIIDYENGMMEWDRTVEFFQKLIDNGMAWSLQGHYGRTAMALIEEGYCQMPNQKDEKLLPKGGEDE